MSDRTVKQLNDTRRVNISIWRDTMQKSEYYNSDRAVKCTYIEDDDIMDKIPDVIPMVKVFHENIYDTLNALHEHNFRSPKPLLIIPGINNFPIAGVKKGVSGDEADFIRRSNYYLSIEESDYPITEGQSLYSPTVVVFKNDDHKRLENPVSISVLNIPPMHSPKLISMSHPSGKGYIEVFDSKNDEDKVRRRIFMMFKTAIMNNHDTIIITNYGSDSNNPMEKVCEFFKEAIEKYPIPFVFFAIKTHNRREKDKYFHMFNRLVR